MAIHTQPQASCEHRKYLWSSTNCYWYKPQVGASVYARHIDVRICEYTEKIHECMDTVNIYAVSFHTTHERITSTDKILQCSTQLMENKLVAMQSIYGKSLVVKSVSVSNLWKSQSAKNIFFISKLSIAGNKRCHTIHSGNFIILF